VDDSPCFCLLCAPPADGPAWEERDSRITKSVTEVGWHVMGVGAGDDAPADWAYSIGLWHTLRSPEVCVFGLPIETGMSVVNAAGAGIRGGLPLEPDQHRDDVLNNYDVALRPVHSSWYWDFFGAGIDFYQAPPLPITQLFWPDAFPGTRKQRTTAVPANRCCGSRRKTRKARGPNSPEITLSKVHALIRMGL
jgi:hypothetical protein